tara:strand:+ start:83 stop:580 length:498 start_codon:yes stop_codon:yes gene_type:complete
MNTMINKINKNDLLNIIKSRATTTDANLKNQDKKAFIYLAKSSYGTYKIGFSINPEQRVRAFNSGSYFDVELLEKIPTEGLVRHLEGRTINVMGVISSNKKREWVRIPSIDSKIVQETFKFIVKNMITQIRKNVRTKVRMENKVLEKYNIKQTEMFVQTSIALSR